MNRTVLSAALTGALGAAVLAWSPDSRAQQVMPSGFGETSGQLIFSADRLFGPFSYTHASVTETNNGTTTVTSTNGSSISLLGGLDPQFVGNQAIINPFTIPRASIDYTVVPHVAVGGSVILGFGLGGSNKTEVTANNNTTSNSADAPTTTVFGLAPRGGYILGLNDKLALWLRGGFSFYATHIRTVNNNGNGNGNNNNQTTTSNNGTLFALDLDPQLVIVPVEHLFFSVGPVIDIPLAGSEKVETTNGPTTTTTSLDLSIFHFGIVATLGGWMVL